MGSRETGRGEKQGEQRRWQQERKGGKSETEGTFAFGSHQPSQGNPITKETQTPAGTVLAQELPVRSAVPCPRDHLSPVGCLSNM